MTVAIAISVIAHGLVLGSFAASARFAWPAPPIPIEIQPRRIRPPSPATDPALPPAASAPRPRRPGDGPRNAPDTPAAATPPATADLKPFAPDDANLVVLLRTDKLRRSPHRKGLEGLLEVFPDWALLVAGTDFSPLDDFEALLIATADPRDVTATFLAARHHNLARVRTLAARPFRPGDPRVFRFPAPGLAVLTHPGNSDPRDRWLAELDRFDQVAREPNGPAVLVTISDAPALIRLGDGLPTPDALALAMTADASPAVRVRLVFAAEPDAARFESAWPEILRRYRTATVFLGLSPALDGLSLHRRGGELELEGKIPEPQVRLGLAFARALFPQYQRPYSVDAGAPP